MKILVAFTEPETTASLSKMLVELGYPEPGAVHDSDNAIDWINSSGGCDLLIAEVYFSPADGFTLRDTVQPFLPEMRTLLSSRFDISPYVDRLGTSTFLPQPIKLDSLQETLLGFFGKPQPASLATQPDLIPSDGESHGAEPSISESRVVDSDTAQAVDEAPQKLLPISIPKQSKPKPKRKKTSKAEAEETSSSTDTQTFVVESKESIPSAPPAAEIDAQPQAIPQKQSQPAFKFPQPAIAQNKKPLTPRIPTTTIKFEDPAPKTASAGLTVSERGLGLPSKVPVAKVTAKPSVAQTAHRLISVGSAPAPTAKQPVPVAAAPKPKVPTPVPSGTDELVGKTIGNYEILSLSSKFQTERTYRARQTNIERQVFLTVLDPESSQDSAVRERFLADARAKAKVSHPTIAAVYEGGSDNGFQFYSSEMIVAPSLAQIQSEGGSIKPLTALQIFQVVAEAFAYFSKEKIPHLPISAEAIILKPGATPRLVNIACGDAGSTPTNESEMQALGEIVHKAVTQAPEFKPARDVAARLLRAADQPITWWEVAALAASKMPKAAPADAAKIQARDITISKAVGASRKKSRRGLIIGSIVSLTLTAAACFAIYYHLNRSNKVKVKDLGAMVEIPAGEFAYQSGRAETPKFYISKYEVSIYEYKKFLDALAADPGLASIVAHPSQPPGKSHVPKGWADETELDPPNPGYFTRARKWGQYQGADLTLDSPVFGVDWFDAYAYAKWKGHRLPTEQEWEKAARGPKGTKFPWGEEADPKSANTGADFTTNPSPKAGGAIDGFKRSSPVNKPAGDESGFGVIGMAGNVSEWTATLDEDPEMPGEQIPVIRGGNWKNPSDPSIIERKIKFDEVMTDETLGFRTVSESPPAPAQ